MCDLRTHAPLQSLPARPILVEQSGTLAELDAFLFAHNAELSLRRNGNGIYVARVRGRGWDVQGCGLDLVGALLSAVEKVVAAEASA